MRKLAPRPHGYIDYLVVLLFVLAPTIFGYADDGAAATTTYFIAALHFGLSVLTRYPLGIVKLIPFPIHGGIELAAAISLVVLPWIVGFNHDAAPRNLFVISAIAIFGVWLVTDYRAAELEGPRRGMPLTR